MGEANVKKTNFFKGVRAEFRKIIWPDTKTVVRQSYTVVITVLVLGAIIAAIDAGFQYVVFDLILGNL